MTHPFNILSYANSYAQAAAERQAVNSTVQGSAADLVKKAMIDIHLSLVQMFPKCQNPLRESNNVASSSQSRTYLQEGAHFILQLHDELFYEVVASDLMKVASIVKQNMENAMNLSVPFPVKIKIGSSWGDLTEIQMNKIT